MLKHCKTLQHTAICCNTLQHTATHCNTLQDTATRCDNLQHTATRYNVLQHTAPHCKSLQHAHTAAPTGTASGMYFVGLASVVCFRRGNTLLVYQQTTTLGKCCMFSEGQHTPLFWKFKYSKLPNSIRKHPTVEQRVATSVWGYCN